MRINLVLGFVKIVVSHHYRISLRFSSVVFVLYKCSSPGGKGSYAGRHKLCSSISISP